MKALKTFLSSMIVTFGTQSALAQAQAPIPWPTKPVRIIVPYGAGGAGDNLARVLGEVIAKNLKQPVVIENKPGASGMLGGAACKNSAPDGYTFCLFLMDVVAINPAIFKKVPYKAESDFVPVAYVAEVGAVMPVSANVPVSNVEELMAYSKAHPATANWGSFGVGSSSHLVLELMNKRFGASLTHVPYQTTPALITAVMTGEVTTTFAGYAQLKQHIDQGKLRVIATMGEKRLAQLPDVPTLVEQGVDFKSAFWWGVFAPTGTPAESVNGMHDTVNKAVVDPTVAKVFETMSVFVKPMTQAQFGELVKRDSEVWRGIAQQANISLD